MRKRYQVLGILTAGLLAEVGVPPAGGQNASEGVRDFATCSVCHDTGSAIKRGPGLSGILGRHAGRASGFRYSRAMKNAKIVWDENTLDAYLADPQGLIPGSVMPFPGIADPRLRADLIAYLKTLK